jgi:hypothetical protein
MRCLFAILGIVAFVGAQYDYGFDHRSTTVKRQSSSLPLTGVHNPDGTMGLRREVGDLETDTTTWNLYMLGLDMMQYTDQSQMESWYQIMGNFLSPPRAYILKYQRYPRSTIRSLRQCPGDNTRQLPKWLLHTHLNSLPDMASPVSRSLRTNPLQSDPSHCGVLASRCGQGSTCCCCG